ncbi:MAG: 4-hydroxy-tetrahydrodipicolinate reductase [Candidatus Latescibacteria bacterium]|nr:4-hydroxy-tetrahydrodipicolinate reductase [Candidatus Latescibacterota bacterium]
MIRVILSGAAGRMGRAVGKLMAACDDMTIVGAVGRPGRGYLGMDYGELIGVGRIGVAISADLESVLDRGDTLVEFSTPDATVAHVQLAVSRGLSAVVGTTGLSPEQSQTLATATARIPCVVAPNLSVGAHLLTTIARMLSSALGEGFDVEVLETHHRFKQDAPSGTARAIINAITEGRARPEADQVVHGRHGRVGPRQAGEIGVHAIRAGDIVGDHTVMFGGLGERLEITHRAHSVETFAHGTLRAVRFLQGKPPGLYGMADIIKTVTSDE